MTEQQAAEWRVRVQEELAADVRALPPIGRAFVETWLPAIELWGRAGRNGCSSGVVRAFLADVAALVSPPPPTATKRAGDHYSPAEAH